MRLQRIEWLTAARGPGLVSSAKMDSVGAKGLAALGYTATASAKLNAPWIVAACTCAECVKWR